jgi:hypothetical protein
MSLKIDLNYEEWNVGKLKFREREKSRYEGIKDKLFSEEARKNGSYKKIPRSFCIADEYSYENLYQGIRDSAISYFLIRGIPWHDGLKVRHLPSNHLCCSQSCCVNFLFPLMKRPNLVKAIFHQYYTDLKDPLPITGDKPLTDGTYPFIAFEWIGTRDYLEEAKRKGMQRTRGANFTSADFVLRFQNKNGEIHLVLGEWKYTEEYGRSYKGSGRAGEVRKNNYVSFFKDPDGVFNNNNDIDKLYDSLFYEPFYQLMRLQLLAQVMEADKDKEMHADIVSVLHICPEANIEFRKNVTSGYLRGKFSSVEDVLGIWDKLVPDDKFMSTSVESLLDTIVIKVGDTDRAWVDYLKKRYDWRNTNA